MRALKKMSPAALCLAFLLGSIGLARGAPCLDQSYDGVPYTVCTVDIRRDHLAMFSQNAAGRPYATFDRLAASLGEAHRTIAFAMNAGMYEVDLSPVGLLIERGAMRHPATTHDGAGNFFLKPNGVFFFGPQGVGILDTQAYLAEHLRPELATQSGPLLVSDGKFNPQLQPDGTSLKIRNGVGVRDRNVALFVISDAPVSFFKFASFFRDRLGCRNALYLDGTVSALYAPGLGRSRQPVPLGPMIGVTTP